MVTHATYNPGVKWLMQIQEQIVEIWDQYSGSLQKEDRWVAVREESLRKDFFVFEK